MNWALYGSALPSGSMKYPMLFVVGRPPFCAEAEKAWRRVITSRLARPYVVAATNIAVPMVMHPSGVPRHMEL